LLAYFAISVSVTNITALCYKKAQVTQELRANAPSIIPRWPSAAILDIIEPEIAPFDLPNPKTLA